MRRSIVHLLAAVPAAATLAAPAAAITFGGVVAVRNGTDRSTYTDVGNNRLGGFGSDLAYDAGTGLYYGITDRGPGGGVLSYAPRVQTFTLSTNGTTGAIANFNLVGTTVFRYADGTTFNGLNPRAATGNAGTLGNAFDSEGFARLSNGNMLVSDEYGPSLYEFTSAGIFVRAFNTPTNLIPRQSDGTVNYVDGRPTITAGRQDNRGFEGLTVTPDGRTAYAILQDPLVNEGSNNGAADGRYSRNVRIVSFDVATGQSNGQYIYQLEPLADINARADVDFSANQQGRSIGVSALQSLGNGKFLVLERDNRGLGTETNANEDPASKRAFLIDLTNATDVTNISLAGTNALPAGVRAADKTSSPYVDILAQLRAAGEVVPEKIEGMAFGEFLADGGRTLLFITDNDFSVTQNGSGTQFDVCVAGNSRTQVAIGAGCPAGSDLIPTYIYSFKLSRDEYQTLIGTVPEPTTWAMLIAGFGLMGGAIRARARKAAPALA